MPDLLLSLAAAAAGYVAVAGACRVAAPWLTNRQPAAVAVLAMVAGAGTAAAPAEPTGEAVTDLLLRAALGGLVTVAAGRARRWSLLAASAAVAVAAPQEAVWLAAAFVALGAAVRTGAARRRTPPVGAAIGPLVVNVCLRLEWPDVRLGTAAVAAVAIGVVVLSALRRTRGSRRRRLAAAAGALAFAAVVAVALYAVPAATAPGDVEEAQTELNAALDLARTGDVAAAQAGLAEAAERLRRVEDRIGGWWARPVRHVPVAAQQARAVDALVGAAEEVAARAQRALEVADPERVRPRNGRVDLAALATFEEPLAAALESLDDATALVEQVRSPWLLPLLDDRLDELDRRARGARRDSATALDAVQQVPWLLGEGGQRRWFLAVAQPAELRGGGGFIGNWGILTATDGRIELPVFRRIADLYREEPYGVSVDPVFDARYLERFGLDRWPQNLLVSPHLPSSAQAISDVLEATGEGPVDGVIVVDPHGLAALLELTGAVEVAGWPEPLTSANAAEILLYRQYLDAEREDRVDFLLDVTEVVFDRLTSGVLPSPARIGEVLGPAADQQRFQLFAFDPEAQAFLRRLRVDGSLRLPVTDGLAVVSHNAAASKIDWFLRRSVTYDLEVDPQSGAATGVAEVRLRNTAPSDLPDNGYLGKPDGAGIGGSLLMTGLYTPLELTELTVDGEPSEPDPSAERGYRVYDKFTHIPPGEEVVLRFEVQGELPVLDGHYRLDVHRQPTAHPDELKVRVNGETLFDGEHVSDLVLEADL